MPKRLTITLPDDAYGSLRTLADAIHRTPEELAAQVVLEKFGALEQHGAQSAPQGQDMRAAVLAVMRQRRHLAEAQPSSHPRGASSLPPLGSPERERLNAAVASDLGDALALSGLSVLDLIERR